MIENKSAVRWVLSCPQGRHGAIIPKRACRTALFFCARRGPSSGDKRTKFVHLFRLPGRSHIAPRDDGGRCAGGTAVCVMSTMTLVEFFQTHYIKEWYLTAEATIETYMSDVRFLDPYWREHAAGDRPLTLDDMNETLIVAAMNHRLNVRGNSPATANRMRRNVLALWNQAWRMRLVDRDWRSVRKARELHHEPVAWTTEQLAVIFTAASYKTGWVGEVRARHWWPALLWTIYNTGLRITATMELRTANLDLRGGILQVDAATQKHREGQTFHLLRQTVEALRAIRPDRNEKVFADWPFDQNMRQWLTLSRHYRGILIVAGIDQPTRQDMFHKLRKTFATVVSQASGEATAQRMLGHSSPQTTRRYLDPRFVNTTPLRDILPVPQTGPFPPPATTPRMARFERRRK